MEFAPAGVPLTCEVTFDASNLHVGMSVYDVTDSPGAPPVLVDGPFAMSLAVGNTYYGKFVADNGKSYVIEKAVYTTSALDVLDTNYSAGSESIVAESFTPSSNSSGCEVIGQIINQPTLIGIVTC